MQNTLKKWIGAALGAVCLALTPAALNLGAEATLDASLSEAQCATCCIEPGSICVIGPTITLQDHYRAPGTDLCDNS